MIFFSLFVFIGRKRKKKWNKIEFTLLSSILIQIFYLISLLFFTLSNGTFVSAWRMPHAVQVPHNFLICSLEIFSTIIECYAPVLFFMQCWKTESSWVVLFTRAPCTWAKLLTVVSFLRIWMSCYKFVRSTYLLTLISSTNRVHTHYQLVVSFIQLITECFSMVLSFTLSFIVYGHTMLDCWYYLYLFRKLLYIQTVFN